MVRGETGQAGWPKWARRVAHAPVKIFDCARGGVGSFAFSVQRGLCNGLRLGLRAEYSRRRSSMLNPGPSGKDFSRAEYTRRRSSIVDPGFSETIRNI